MKTDWEQSRAIACRVALEAWLRIRHYFRGQYEIERKNDGTNCTEADKAADVFIVQRLKEFFGNGDYGYMSEESVDRPERLECDRVWIIDPIDGTQDFIAGSKHFSIHIALVEKLGDGLYHPVAAVVYSPVAEILYSAVRGAGAVSRPVAQADLESLAAKTDGVDWGEGEPVLVSGIASVEEARSVISNAKDTRRVMKFINSLPLADYWKVGSMGVKLCQISEGKAELYVNVGPGHPKEWDSCAPYLVLKEAGGRMTDLDGGELTFNRPNVAHVRGLVATNGLIHEAMLEHIVRFLGENGG